MIPVQELRVGNIVKIDDEYLGPIEGKVTSLNEKAEVELLLSANKGNIIHFRCGAEDIFPIPITEELLLKCGFEKEPFSSKIYKIDTEDSSVVYYFEGNMLDIRTKDNNRISVMCKFVHQLQNAYYLLTDDELEIII